MGDRRKARELALQALFFFDMEKDVSADRLPLFCSSFSDMISDGVKPFFMDLVEGVEERKENVDGFLADASKNWRLDRMSVVDRNLMRIAAFEMVYMDDIPSRVSMNEAIEIAKRFGDRNSASFVNGVLDKVKSSKELG